MGFLYWIQYGYGGGKDFFFSNSKWYGILSHNQTEKEGEIVMTESRVALIGIIVSSKESVEQLNHLLSEYGSYIIGRMGLPYKERNISIISVAIDAPSDVINSLTGKLGMLPGISTKTIYPKNA